MTLALRDDVAALSTLALCLCRNAADADDLVQDTLERALRAQARYVERGSFRAWLGTILRNRHRDRHRERRRRPQDNLAVEKLPAPEPEQPRRWEHVTEAQVAAALAQLEPGFREVYELHRAGRSYKQIASELGIASNTVGTRLFRARTKLREILLASSTGDGDRRDAAGRSGPSAG